MADPALPRRSHYPIALRLTNTGTQGLLSLRGQPGHSRGVSTSPLRQVQLQKFGGMLEGLLKKGERCLSFSELLEKGGYQTRGQGPLDLGKQK